MWPSPKVLASMALKTSASSGERSARGVGLYEFA